MSPDLYDRLHAKRYNRYHLRNENNTAPFCPRGDHSKRYHRSIVLAKIRTPCQLPSMCFLLSSYFRLFRFFFWGGGFSWFDRSSSKFSLLFGYTRSRRRSERRRSEKLTKRSTYLLEIIRCMNLPRELRLSLCFFVRNCPQREPKYLEGKLLRDAQTLDYAVFCL